MNEQKTQCLEALSDITAPNGERCTPFAPIEDATGLDRRTVRRHIRSLARDGLAEYFKGLFDDDGNLGGAGYCITTKGRDAIQDKYRCVSTSTPKK